MYRYLTVIWLGFLLVSCSGGSGGNEVGPTTDACSILGLTSRVINGTACSTTSSAVVKVTITGLTGSVAECTGTLLTSTDVLTAAHCFLLTVPVLTQVEVGGTMIDASRVIVHPQASYGAEVAAVFNDAAIIRLSASTSTKPLPLLVSRSASEGDIISIFGFGLDDSQVFGTLRSGQMRVSQATENHIFANFEGDGSNACSGDSGGPAIYSFTDDNGNTQNAIAGIVSSGSKVDCSKGDTTLFSNVQSESVLSFILDLVPTADTV